MIFFKKFIIAQPLIEMFSFFDMLYKNKNNVVKRKNQNGGLIQDGNEKIIYFHINRSPF
jgi:hypothetical protein